MGATFREVQTPPRKPTVKPRRLRMSYQEYLKWAGYNILAEWVNGDAIIHMPPTRVHQRLVHFLAQLLSSFVRLFERGEVLTAPFEVKLSPDGPSREPDILFVAQEHLDRLTDERAVGPPDLIVEVISPDSVRRDRDDKFREYERAGVTEYWIVDSRPRYRRADFYRLDEEGRYTLFATEDDEVVHSTVLTGFWLRPLWVWQDPHPHPLLALAEIVGPQELIKVVRDASPERGEA